MSYLKNLFPFVLACCCIVACNDSADQQKTGNTTNTNTAASTATVPDSLAAAPTTIYNIWVVDTINGKAPDSTYFAHGSPYFDFNSEKNSISGFTGCNGLNGKFSLKDQRVIFDSLTITKQRCMGRGKEFEKILLAGFRSGKTTYKIQNELLYLDLGNSNLILRKIRR